MERDTTAEMRQVKLLRVEHLYKNGLSIANACKTIGISVHTYYKWRRETQANLSVHAASSEETTELRK